MFNDILKNIHNENVAGFQQQPGWQNYTDC